MNDLIKKKCVPCEGGTQPLTSKDREFNIYHDQVKNWTVSENEKKLERNFKFKDFKAALDFVNQTGEISESENHHPDIYLHNWNMVTLTLTTHAIGGLSVNDFILAAKINEVKL